MPYIADNPEQYVGQVVASGQCVDYVRETALAPHTSEWRQGAHARSRPHKYGTAIATFGADGTYGNHTTGESHAAILIGYTTDGLMVFDQWTNQPVHERTIRFKGGEGMPCDDGDAYHVIES